MKSSAPRRSVYLNRKRRRLLAESLEDRRMLAVSFEFNYIGGNTLGFNDPLEGPTFRVALESAAQRVGNSLLHNATVQMDVVSKDFVGSAIAKAVSEPAEAIPGGGFAYGVIPNKLINGSDTNGTDADGHLEVYFFDASDPFTYVTDPAAISANDELDFQAAIIHELVHTLGFTSATNLNGSDDRGNGITTPGTWTVFDQFLSDVSGNRLIDADPASPTAFQMDTDAWATHSVGGKGPDGGLFFDGPMATAVYGARVPLYSPTNFQLESSVSHLDSEGFPDSSFVFSPNIYPMSHAIVSGPVPQELTLLEKAILADIGIMVHEDVPPQVTAPANLVVEATSRGGFLGTNQAIADYLASASAVDQVDPAPVITNDKPTQLALGQNVITFTATDASGNIGTATSVISVVDTTPPNLEVSPTSVMLEATSAQGVVDAVLPFAVTVDDLVDPNPILRFDGGSTFPLGTTIATYSARDFRNNVATFDVEIIVSDTTSPVFDLPAAVTISSNTLAGADLTNDELLELIRAVSSDMVDLDLAISAQPPEFPIGTTTVMFTVTDDSGNSSVSSTELTVEDGSLVVRTLDDELDPDPEANLDDLSLREAISLANANPGIDNVRFEASLRGSVMLEASLGQLTITDSLTISGLGSESTIIDGQSNIRVFTVIGDQVDVTLQDLTVRGGRASGELDGGAGVRFETDGTLLVQRVTIADNQSLGLGGAGGGIHVASDNMTLVDSVVTGNQTSGGFAGGGGIWFGGSNLSIVRSHVRDNSTTGGYAAGGGIYALGGVTTITGSTVTGNSTVNDRSGGGAIAMITGDLTVRSSTIANNSTNGSTSPGGGVRTLLAPARLINSTVSGNTTGSSSAGGGIYADRGDLAIDHSTITGNSASGSGGGIALPTSATLLMTIRNSIIANNQDSGTAPDLLGTGTLPIDQAVRYSLIGDNAGTSLPESQTPDPSTGNVIGSTGGGGDIDPSLGPLADNGGPTPTHVLLVNSPALNAGDPSFDVNLFSPPLLFDQRGDGFNRILDGRIDMGAVESESDVVINWDQPDDITYGAPLSSTQLNATANAPGTFVYTPPIGVFLNAGPNQVLRVTFTPSLPGLDPVSKTVQINVNKADPVITWEDPHDVVVGTQLSETQLNAVADVAGTFAYNPPLGSVLGVGEDQVLTATFTPNNPDNYNVVSAMVLIDVILPHDFGDAPGTYPVTLAQDGARHLPDNLFLGDQVDAESDGQASLQADGDGDDEDGMTLVADLVVAPGNTTTASWFVEASDAGKLDAWIDFNRDGDWDDPGEKVHDNVPVATGGNLLGFPVPAGASAGATFARLRISSVGGLDPVGEVTGGEVEDHPISMLNGSNSPDATARMVNEALEISFDAGEIVVRQGNVESFRTPIQNLGSLIVEGTPAVETVTIDLQGGPLTPAGGVVIDGSTGDDVLVVQGGGGRLDLTNPDFVVRQFRRVDLTNPDDNVMTFDVGAIDRLSPIFKFVEIIAGLEDTIEVPDALDWRMTQPLVINDTFILTAVHTGGSGEKIHATLPRPWQNFLRPGDVNNDGQISGSDAIRIINELARPFYFDPVTSALVDPLTVSIWPETYFDQNGDQKLTSLDALRVINDMAREAMNRVSGEAEFAGLVQSSTTDSTHLDSVFADDSRVTPWMAANQGKDRPLFLDAVSVDSSSQRGQQVLDDQYPFKRPDVEIHEDAVDQLLSELDVLENW